MEPGDEQVFAQSTREAAGYPGTTVVVADTVLTVGNTMIVAGVVLAIVLLLRAARRGPTRPQLPPDGGISGLDRRRSQPTIQSTYGRPPRVEPPGPPRLRRRRPQQPTTDTSATAPIDTSTAPTTTWRSEETWGDDRRSGDTWADTGSYDTGSHDSGSSSGDSGGGDSGGGGGSSD